ncbi:MAG TPA: hypothetical protein VFR59_03275 [Steroidobacteraceae bacterium]|nr:hypothetical protein [Steroidobacteraceae bacterium]
MPPDTAMTGTFQAKLPTDLLSAIQRNAIEGPGKDFTVGSMKPSLMERFISLMGRRRKPVRKS